MARQTKEQKVKNLINEGKTDQEIAAATGWFTSKIAQMRSGKTDFSTKPVVTVKELTLGDLKLDLNVDAIKTAPIVQAEPIKTVNSAPQQQKSQVFDISSGSTNFGSSSVSNTELAKFQGYMATQVARFESALFKAMTEEPMPVEERQMLEEAWLGIMKIVIKDTNMELAVAVILLGTAHGTIYLMHREKINEGIAKVQNKKAIAKGTDGQEASNSSRQPPKLPELPTTHPKANISEANQILLRGDSLK
jgi:hypothetical protein